MKYGDVPAAEIQGESRSPHGERGLKYNNVNLVLRRDCRSPHGERGLKYITSQRINRDRVSLPARGAWVEIT